MSKSTGQAGSRKAAADRPKKPYPDFPLSPHASGAWQKKIRGKIHYFGKWARVVKGKLTRIEGDGWEEALKLYKVQADDLHAGRTPRVSGDGLTVNDLCNHFRSAMKERLDTGRKMSPRMYAEYCLTTDRLVSTFGGKRLVDDLAPDDFAGLASDLAKQYGPVRRGNEVQKVRTVFKYGITNRLIKTAIQFGSAFVKPDRTELRMHRAKKGKRLFAASELRSLIDAAGVPLKAMILLGINAAFGNADCGHLPQSAVDLEGGWITFPRPKTGIARRAALWPETVEALKAAMAERPAPTNEANAELVFVTKYGRPWSSGGTSGAVTLETGKLLRELKLNRPGLGFYALRHTFRTVADATKDFPAVRFVMGHVDGSIDDVYREGIEDSRLQAVADHVHAWLFGKTPDGGKTDEPQESANENSEPIDPPQNGEAPRLRLFAG
jgi:integrase